MKRTILLSAILLLLGVFSMDTLLAQAPNAMFYQAEARDARGHAIKNKKLKVKITILAGDQEQQKVWEAYHNVVTDQFGMFDLIIGEGEPTRYKFSNIEWGNDAHFLNVEVLYKNRWTNMGTTPFMSVPYALDARRVEQRAFDDLDVSESLTVGDGLTINKIFEITGMTDEVDNHVDYILPEGMTSVNIRVLDIAIYQYHIVGLGTYHGQGVNEGSGQSIGYKLHHSIMYDWTFTLSIYYPDFLKGKPYRVLLMLVEDPVPIGYEQYSEPE